MTQAGTKPSEAALFARAYVAASDFDEPDTLMRTMKQFVDAGGRGVLTRGYSRAPTQFRRLWNLHVSALQLIEVLAAREKRTHIANRMEWSAALSGALPLSEALALFGPRCVIAFPGAYPVEIEECRAAGLFVVTP
jgi:hypothetical protein